MKLPAKLVAIKRDYDRKVELNKRSTQKRETKRQIEEDLMWEKLPQMKCGCRHQVMEL